MTDERRKQLEELTESLIPLMGHEPIGDEFTNLPSMPTAYELRELLADSRALEKVVRFGAVAFENWIRGIKQRLVEGSDELIDLLADARDTCLAAQKETP